MMILETKARKAVVPVYHVIKAYRCLDKASNIVNICTKYVRVRPLGTV
jgi:hypothetical protein